MSHNAIDDGYTLEVLSLGLLFFAGSGGDAAKDRDGDA